MACDTAPPAVPASAEVVPPPPSAIRVFCGYKKGDVVREEFLRELGATFMPGTPHMLQPLGLAFYLAAVPPLASDPRYPEELGLIGYPSQEEYQRIRRGTLQGRLYTHTHAALYHPTRRLSGFPVPLGQTPPVPQGAAYLFEAAIDWQQGASSVHILVGSADGRDGQLRAEARTQLLAATTNLQRAGCDQCLAAFGDGYVALWLHYATPVPEPYPWPELAAVGQILYSRQFRRVLCDPEPPVVALAEGDAVNFLFVRVPPGSGRTGSRT